MPGTSTMKSLSISHHRKFAFGAIALTAPVIICLALAEIVLRLLPVADILPTVPVTAASRIIHFTPNSPFTYSHGWNFDIVNHGRVNNAGWINDQDYREADPTPLIAVVGDSFIEAAMVPCAQTMQGRLAAALEGKFRVYSFGVAGAPLSQYLVWAQHAVRRYGARAAVINVIGNDFDESHVAYSTPPGMWVYAPRRDGRLELRLFEYKPGWLRPFAERSALLRYLLVNLKMGSVWREMRWNLFGRPAMAAPRYAGNTTADFDDARIQASLAAIDAALRDLPEMVGLPADRIIFTLDGFRYAQAARDGAGTYFDLMRVAFRRKAESLGYEVIDLDPLFFAHAAKRAERFEFATDFHWNGTGHGVAAEGVLASKLIARLIKLDGVPGNQENAP